ncbi:MULE domain-containing protein [Aphis craccivora]|uniref:MULE domain-containing protein n=1 Tax=Aphis craccivora TaxID=307492 RepID=A0A6G0Y6M2_APHCR|nr:MULE domain-containing protein [Aphis craccivora]
MYSGGLAVSKVLTKSHRRHFLQTFKINSFRILKKGDLSTLTMNDLSLIRHSVHRQQAIHSAVAEVFPNAKIRGCRFHLGQSWWRKMQSLELTKILPFLDFYNFIDCFTDDILAIVPTKDDRVEQFTDRVFENYLLSPDAMFPPNTWAQISASCNRTTNGCEIIQSETSNGVKTKKICEKEAFIRTDDKANTKRIKAV